MTQLLILNFDNSFETEISKTTENSDQCVDSEVEKINQSVQQMAIKESDSNLRVSVNQTIF